jgi:hypothetical protein
MTENVSTAVETSPLNSVERISFRPIRSYHPVHFIQTLIHDEYGDMPGDFRDGLSYLVDVSPSARMGGPVGKIYRVFPHMCFLPTEDAQQLRYMIDHFHGKPKTPSYNSYDFSVLAPGGEEFVVWARKVNAWVSPNLHDDLSLLPDHRTSVDWSYRRGQHWAISDAEVAYNQRVPRIDKVVVHAIHRMRKNEWATFPE